MHNNTDPAVARSGEQAAAQPPHVNAAVQEKTKKAFLFYLNWYEDSLISLTEEEQGKFLLVIVRYATSGVLPDDTVPATIRSMFMLIRNAIDSGVEKYEKAVEKNRKANERRHENALKKQAARCAGNQRNSPQGVIHDTSHLIHDTSNFLTEGKKEEEAHSRISDAEPPRQSAVQRSDVEAYWHEHGYKSNAREFFDYYDTRDWLNRKGERIQSWKKAAVMWEDKFRRDVLPVRRREQAAEAAERKARQISEREQIRTAVRLDREAEADRRAAVAVTPDVAKRMYEEALRLSAGNEDQALALLRRADDDLDLHQRLAGG